MKLTRTELKFIDNYLLNSGVEYLDVRMELNDHIASAIECEIQKDTSQTFYEVFKDYMVRNKKNLLQACDLQERKLRHNIVTDFLKNFLTKEVLFLLVLILFINNKLNLIAFQEFFSVLSLAMFVIVLCFYFISFKKLRKISTGKLLIGLIGLLFYCVVYSQNIFGLLIILPSLLLLGQVRFTIKKAIKEEFVVVAQVMVGMLVMVLFLSFVEWSRQFVTSEMVTFYFLFQFILWFVLFKTLLNYKKTILKKYKCIFEKAS